MPELPEVENVKLSLEKNLGANLSVAKSVCLSPKLRVPLKKDLEDWLVGENLLKIERRAKFLLFQFKKGVLINHLGMTGHWRIENKFKEKKHDHFVIEFQDGRSLVYNDVRRFGLITYCQSADLAKNPWLKNLGVEPLNLKSFTPTYLGPLLRSRKTTVKSFLMDQRVLSGVGNIYANEVLFLAKIRPQKKCFKLSQSEVSALVSELPKLLNRAIKAGGSTIKDYQSVNGQSGRFQNAFFVYGRADKKCRNCAQKILAKTLGGRATFWCPNCQK